ncbi:MAG: hypothetical protein H5T64_10645 [Chloroflexi bacterium]|nr:hypothetical protein [Chloroflexota bacterium]
MFRKVSLTLLCLLAMWLVRVSTAAAFPPLPHRFYGMVTANGRAVPDGTIIDVWSDRLRWETRTTTVSGWSWYDILIPGDDLDTPDQEGAREGHEVVFDIRGYGRGGISFWHAGGYTRFDLNYTAPPTPIPPTPTRTATPTFTPARPDPSTACPRAAADDYAPRGLPDFEQRQSWWQGPMGQWTHDGPTALADVLWWLDSKAGHGLGGWPGLITSFGSWSDHDPRNVPPLIENLAEFASTGAQGTTIEDLQSGLLAYLASRGLSDAYYVQVERSPSPTWIAEHSAEGLLMLLGLWQDQGQPQGWVRIGGHYVAVNCLSASGTTIEIADPLIDHAAMGGPGRCWPDAGTAITMGLHNDAAYVSYDQYYMPIWVSVPGANWGLRNYAGSWINMVINNCAGLNSSQELASYSGTWNPSGNPVVVAVDYALAITANPQFITPTPSASPTASKTPPPSRTPSPSATPTIGPFSRPYDPRDGLTLWSNDRVVWAVFPPSCLAGPGTAEFEPLPLPEVAEGEKALLAFRLDLRDSAGRIAPVLDNFAGVVLWYDAEDIVGFENKPLRVWWYDPHVGWWMDIACEHNASSRMVWFLTRKLGRFCLLAADFDLRLPIILKEHRQP